MRLALLQSQASQPQRGPKGCEAVLLYICIKFLSVIVPNPLPLFRSLSPLSPRPLSWGPSLGFQWQDTGHQAGTPLILSALYLALPWISAFSPMPAHPPSLSLKRTRDFLLKASSSTCALDTKSSCILLYLAPGAILFPFGQALPSPLGFPSQPKNTSPLLVSLFHTTNKLWKFSHL